jgi:uncharacterized protein YegP (UPF0339 family)
MHFTIYQDIAGGWRWTLYAENNRKIADSGESYEASPQYTSNAVRGGGARGECPSRERIFLSPPPSNIENI